MSDTQQTWPSARGRLKVFLGYASGVGKSFRMFDEGRRRKERGQDVVVAAHQAKIPADVESVLGSLEIVPTLTIKGVPVIDVETILHRHPQICLVDGLAYDNPPGSRNAHRWQDVEELLAAGITVAGTVNLQYIEDQRETVEQLTGKRVTQTIPKEFLNTADEIVIVDAPTEKSTRAPHSPARNGPGPFCRGHRRGIAALSPCSRNRAIRRHSRTLSDLPDTAR